MLRCKFGVITSMWLAFLNKSATTTKASAVAYAVSRRGFCCTTPPVYHSYCDNNSNNKSCLSSGYCSGGSTSISSHFTSPSIKINNEQNSSSNQLQLRSSGKVIAIDQVRQFMTDTMRRLEGATTTTTTIIKQFSNNVISAVDKSTTIKSAVKTEKEEEGESSDERDVNVEKMLRELNFELMANRSLHPERGIPGVDDLLAYNRLWAQKVKEVDPEYFHSHAKQQTPHYLWIGCSDSRVPESQIVGLAPGEIFVHRNVANVISRCDLNSLSAIQFAVEVLGVDNIIVCGHHGCGGVRAAYYEASYGLVDNWVMNVIDVKHRYEWSVLRKIKEKYRIPALVELNVLVQLCNVAESTAVQDWWHPESRSFGSGGGGYPTIVKKSASNLNGNGNNNDDDKVHPHRTAATDERGDTDDPQPHPVTLHGWVYGLEEGLVHPLITFDSFTNLRNSMENAVAEILERYTKLSKEKP